MDAETLKALKGSIVKWQAIVEGTGVDRGPDNCPLCQKFNKFHLGEVGPATLNMCDGCPVATRTGVHGCRETPYVTFEEHEDDGNEEGMEDAAKRELAFLISLLPEGETP